MWTIVLIECVLISYLSIGIYGAKLNPVSVMTVPWCVMVCGYELRLIQYENLSILTYFVVILAILVYSIGAIVGYCPLSDRAKYSSKFKQRSTGTLSFPDRKTLRRIILFLAVVGSIPTFISLERNISTYGFKFIYHVTQFYSDRITGVAEDDSIPYIGSLLYVASILSCIYFARFGLNATLCLPIVVLAMRPFVSGGRQSLLEVLVILIVTISSLSNVDRDSANMGKGPRTFALLIAMLSALGGLLLFVSGQRSRWTLFADNYASPAFAQLINRVPGLYQIYEYCTAPVGVLNAFLSHPEYSFGANTLMPVFNLANKFGLGIRVNRFQRFYYIPIRTNVGTAVRELIEDYGILVAFIFIFLCGWLLGRAYSNCRQNPSITAQFVSSFGLFLGALSWFSWMLRDANLIIAGIVGWIVCRRLEKKSAKNVSGIEISSHERGRWKVADG